MEPTDLKSRESWVARVQAVMGGLSGKKRWLMERLVRAYSDEAETLVEDYMLIEDYYDDLIEVVEAVKSGDRTLITKYVRNIYDSLQWHLVYKAEAEKKNSPIAFKQHWADYETKYFELFVKAEGWNQLLLGRVKTPTLEAAIATAEAEDVEV